MGKLYGYHCGDATWTPLCSYHRQFDFVQQFVHTYQKSKAPDHWPKGHQRGQRFISWRHHVLFISFWFVVRGMTSEFPLQRVGNAESVSMSCCHFLLPTLFDLDEENTPVIIRFPSQRASCFLVMTSPCTGLTHWGRDKIDAILQTTFSNAISWMKMFEFRLKFHWGLFLKVQLTIFQHWFR